MALEKVSCFPADGTPQVIAGTPQDGDIVRVVGKHVYYRYLTPSTYTSTPKVLSKTAFQDHAIARLMTTQALTKKHAAVRLNKILKTAKNSNDDAVVFVYQRYTDASTFEKTTLAELTQWLVDEAAPNSLTAAERTDWLDNWPEA